MKITSRDAPAFLKRPKAGTALILLFGPDAMRTSLTRQDFLKSHLGETADEDMRLTRMTGAELRSSPAMLQDAVKAIGFFPGLRGVHVDGATDNLAPIFKDALENWQEEDAIIVAEAGNLGKGSALRKLAEAAPNAAAIGIYAEPPSRATVEDALSKAKLNADNDAKALLFEYARAMDPGDFRQLVEKCALFNLHTDTPLNSEGVAACAPASTEAALDDVIHAAAEGQVTQIGPHLSRLSAQGVNPTTLCISTSRHFKQLHQASSNPGGPDAGMAKLRPPVFGPRRDKMLRQARGWGMYRLEAAMGVLTETDLSLRSSANHPPMALMERAFIRIAMMSPMRK